MDPVATSKPKSKTTPRYNHLDQYLKRILNPIRALNPSFGLFGFLHFPPVEGVVGCDVPWVDPSFGKDGSVDVFPKKYHV